MEQTVDNTSQIVIRDMTPEDIGAGLRLCRASGWNQLEADWSLFLDVSPGGCRVAVKNGGVVGTVATLRYQDRFSWLAMVLVDPRERRAGIGTRLLLEGLSLLAGEPCIRLDATSAGRELYRQHGFMDEYPITRFTTGVDVALRARAVGNVRQMRPQDLPAIFERDREIFGADREALLRSLFLRSPECAWISEGLGVEGYCFGRPGFLYQQLGPIIAGDDLVARDLVSQCLAQADGRRFGIDAPQHSRSWLTWLQGNGFTEERAFMRMHRGANQNPGRPQCVFGIVGPEFG